MNGIIPWIAAEAEDKSNAGELNIQPTAKPTRKFCSVAEPVFSAEDIPAHQFPATQLPQESTAENAAEDYFEDPLDRDPDLWLYRKRTITLLRKYLRYSLETGRLPSILGSEFFRSHVTSYSVTTFEDRVVFVHDVEVCLQKLDEFARKLIGAVILQECNYDDAARRLHCSRKRVQRRIFPSIDELTEKFLAAGVLARAEYPRDLLCEDEEDM